MEFIGFGSAELDVLSYEATGFVDKDLAGRPIYIQVVTIAISVKLIYFVE